MQALVLGTLLAVAALAYVLFPLFVDAVAPRADPRVMPEVDAGKEEAVVALREIEFDRATGKLSDTDYAELRARYTERALDAMRLADAPPIEPDPVEAVVLAYRARLRACVQCGPRPEPDAIYCSHCGRYLPGACAGCGAAVAETGAAFCATCGRRLAA